jgi:hypothetical protein
MLAAGGPTGTSLRHSDAHQGPLQRGAGGGHVGRLHEPALEDTLGFAPRPLGPLQVYLGGHVGGLSKNYDPVRPNLQESAEDREDLFGAASLKPQYALAEQRDQGSVVGQDPHLALTPGHDDLIDVAFEGSPFRSDNL